MPVRVIRRGRWFWSSLASLVLCTGLHIGAAAQQPATDRGDQTSGSAIPNHTAYVQKHCVTCHNDKSKTAGLSLQGVDVDVSAVPARAETWEKVLRKVRSGEMPPPNVRVRPQPAESAALASFLETTLDRAALTNPNPGRPAVHRLNRAEYSNAVRDLLGIDIKPGSWLPVDDSGYGFDNIGAVLSTSPVLLERYMSAARRISRLAVGDVTQKPYEEIYDAPRDPFKGVRNERLTDDLPFDSRAGLSVRHYFPADADYVFKVRFRGVPSAMPGEPDPYEVRVAVKAGLHVVGVTSPRENAKSESEGPGARAVGAGVLPVPYPVDVRLNGARIKRFDAVGGTPEVSRLLIGGPYAPTGRGETASRAKIFVCYPGGSERRGAGVGAPRQEEDQATCAKTILKTLARRAFRRPATNADVDALFEVYERGSKRAQASPADALATVDASRVEALAKVDASRAEALAKADASRAEALAKAEEFESGIQHAIQALLVSPEFLFRVEQDPKSRPARGKAYRVSDLELASRLSFFLWSSIPDDELLDLAERGKLKDPVVLEKQVRRMLEDKRADALIANFAGQWLHLRNVETVTPDPVIFPFDEFLRQAFIKETELLFQSIVREDRSVLDLLRADYTYVNERLAEHYGLPKVYGSQFRRVTVTNPDRRGLLGHGSVLTLTSYPNRTSVVQRGKWILENLLGTPPPPPPPDVPELQAKKDGKALSLREQMEQHRGNPVCAACHARMDPIGFALENYDGVGKWRMADGDAMIDPTGVLPDGTKFQGGAGLTQLMLTKYRDDFVRTAVEKMLTYALGRGVEYYDNPTVRAITREAAKDDYRFSSLILAVVKSTPFQFRRAES